MIGRLVITTCMRSIRLFYIGQNILYNVAMMTTANFRDFLDQLGLSQSEAARLLSVSPRTIRRWADVPSEMPGPAEQALRAWLRLHRLGLAWRPDGVAIGEINPEEIAEQVALYRQHAINLDVLIQKVEARGGPAAPWKVDLNKRQAILGPVRMSFYPLANGGFSPASYSRSDDHHDLERDWPLLEDAFACIADAIAKVGPDWARRTTTASVGGQ